jgi:hypothetical protein
LDYIRRQEYSNLSGHKKDIQHPHPKQEPECKFTEVALDEMFETSDEHWTLKHVIDDQWREYFNLCEPVVATEVLHCQRAANMARTEQFCRVFDLTVKYVNKHQSIL